MLKVNLNYLMRFSNEMTFRFLMPMFIQLCFQKQQMLLLTVPN